MENTKNLEITGWTCHPEDHEFVEAYLTEGGAEIQDRFTIYLEPEDREVGSENGRSTKFRVNFWNELARQAYELIVTREQRLLLKLKNPRVSPYVDQHQGKNRVSLNINFRSQFDVLDHVDCPIGNGFEVILQKLRVRQSGQSSDSPFDSNPF